MCKISIENHKLVSLTTLAVPVLTVAVCLGDDDHTRQSMCICCKIKLNYEEMILSWKINNFILIDIVLYIIYYIELDWYYLQNHLSFSC